MKVKIIGILMMMGTIFGLCGCQMETEGQVDRHYIRIGELEFIDSTVEQEDGSDLAIYQTRIKNNSNYTITGITIDVELEDGKHTTIVTMDTLAPNQTSDWIRCVGPESLSLEDVVMTRFIVNMIDKQNQETTVTYDVGRDFYTYQTTDLSSFDPAVKVDDLVFADDSFIKEDDGVTLQTYLQNRSDYLVQNVMYTFADEAGETYTLYAPLEIKAHHQSQLLTVSALSSETWDDYHMKFITYTYQDGDEFVEVTYDVCLEQYFQK